MTPQQTVEAMVMIAEAAVSKHTNRNSDYGGMSMNRAKEDAIKLLRGPGAHDITQAIHGFADDEVTIEKLTQENSNLIERNEALLESNRDLKQRMVVLAEENEKIKRDYCGF